VAFITNIDLLPRLASNTGFDALVESLSYEELAQGAFLAALYAGMGGEESGAILVSWDVFKQLLSDLQGDGRCSSVRLRGDDSDLPDAITRPIAPGGIGYDENGIWFTTPDTGIYYTRWYVDGELQVRVQKDLSTDRGIIRGSEPGQIDCGPGDTVQIALEDQGDSSIVGWWGKIVIS
jgi:hypothetical protein